ncbi:hypothetical protein BGI41_06160 [Methanobrevibacter sp. 87.7]|uniref:hypothetical protein n=1 Tax=Methanobrevibacter sp. 87.7 TaxID=387957 RepID=UPI000B507AF8|nr:hypothetical protein [Methanobrevibacter sp. 87.7]OWT32724.1 hypothetical protein BGI41_06160 [Methanobrevibacter sp. 87.7]
MVEHQKIIWAGIVSGLVAILTAKFGLSGTVVGSVFSSVLYNFITGYIDEKHKETGGLNIDITKPRLDLELFYIFPLVVILLIEICYIFAFFSSGSSFVFMKLEDVTSNNLFRVIGFGLIILGIYPMFDSKTLKKVNGFLLVICGFLLLGWGLADLSNPMSNVVGIVIDKFGFIISLLISLVLIYVIFSILLRKSVSSSPKRNNHYSKKVYRPNVYREEYQSDVYYDGPYNYTRYDDFEYERPRRNIRHNAPRNQRQGKSVRRNIRYPDMDDDKINSSSKSLKFFSNKKK